MTTTYVKSSKASPTIKKLFETWYWGSDQWTPRLTDDGDYTPQMEESWRVWSAGYTAAQK